MTFSMRRGGGNPRASRDSADPDSTQPRAFAIYAKDPDHITRSVFKIDSFLDLNVLAV